MTHTNLYFNGARVLIVGDVMLDRYAHGSTSRISPEAPVPVVRVTHSECRPGGAANVAINVAALGAGATLVGIVGADLAGAELSDLLKQHDVRTELVVDELAPTICKMRVMSRHQQLLRLDTEDPNHAGDAAKTVYQRAHNLLDAVDILVLSDYAKGALAEAAALIAAANVRGVRVLVDPKGSDFERYRGAFCVTPNRNEFEAVVGECASNAMLEDRGQALRGTLVVEHLLVTRGEEGMTLLGDGDAVHAPALAREVFDVTGAGDTVIAVLASMLAAGADTTAAVHAANAAAGIVVGRLGTAAVTAQELGEAITRGSRAPMSLDENRSLMPSDTLSELVRTAQANGESVVLTNGCFDILHAGHLDSLTRARALGDRLIVALNDDASVARLKGPSRPVVALAQRAALVAALRPVDWVVSFADDTPQALICKLLPDVLVKGGDYEMDEIAGADCVQANGGRVITLDLVAGLSTTKLLAAVTASNELDA